MNERTPEQARSWPPVTLADRLTEVEKRLEGIEYLLAELRETQGLHPLTAPDAARLVEEERYRATALSQNNERRSDA